MVLAQVGITGAVRATVGDLPGLTPCEERWGSLNRPRGYDTWMTTT